MKKHYKSALLAALGLASITAAQAQTSDMLLGFNDAAGPSAAQNDYVIDLGAASQFTMTSTYNVTISSSNFSTAFGADGNALNDVAVGAVEGYTPPSGTGTLFTTAGSPISLVGQAVSWNDAAALAQTSSMIGEYASASTSGWSYYIAASPTAPGNVAGEGFAGYAGNPMSQLSSGVVSLALYESTASLGTRSEAVTAWTDIGTLYINCNTDTVGFSGVNAVPEPGTYGIILAGAGLLVFSLRRQRGRKNA
jgi:hypothetical protein